MKNEILDETDVSNNYSKKSFAFFFFSLAAIIFLIVITGFFLDSLLAIGGSFIVPNTIILVGLILNIFGLLNAYRSMKFEDNSTKKRKIALIGNSVISIFYLFILWVYVDYFIENWL